MEHRKAATLTDIAREVGVSAMTVSAALSGTDDDIHLSGDTRLRVMEAAQKLQYRPNAIDRDVSAKRLNTIGIIAELNYPGDMNLVLHQLLNGIIEGCVLYGQRINIYPVINWATDENNILELCDGLV